MDLASRTLPQQSTPAPMPTSTAPLFERALRPAVGEPRGATVEGSASLQPYSRGLLLWLPDQQRLLVLYATGELGSYSAGSQLSALGEPIAQAAWLPVRLQSCQDGSLLWTPFTGLLILYDDSWRLPLGVAS